jgi:hypothetical protein
MTSGFRTVLHHGLSEINFLVVVFNITSKASFEWAKKFHDDFARHAPDSSNWFLIGNNFQ